MATDTQLSRIAVEVVRTDVDASAQLSRIAVSVVRTGVPSSVQMSRLAITVVRERSALVPTTGVKHLLTIG